MRLYRGGVQMKMNEGTLDRVVRVVIGIVLIVIGAMVVDAGVARWVLVVIGAIALATGIIGWCGLYAALGCSTKKAAEAQVEEPKAPEGTE